MVTQKGQRLWRENIPEDEVRRNEASMEASLREEREKRRAELQHTMKVLEFDRIRQMLAEQMVGERFKQDALELEPAISLSEARDWQMETASALRVIRKKGNFPLPIQSPTQQLLRQAKQGSVLSLEELLHLGFFLTSVRRLIAMIPEASEEMSEAPQELIYDLLRGLIPCDHLEKDITRIVISEEDVADDASPRLLGIRREITRRQASIRQHLDQIVRTHSKALQEQLVTLRGDRYVVPVKVEFRGSIPGLVHDSSSSGQTLFVEPLAVVEANNAVTELRSEERDEILRIRGMLSAAVGELADVIAANVKWVQKLDLICARARLAMDMDATEPKINQRGFIRLHQARHPLIDRKKVVPIDLHIGQEFQTLVITGPNTGGKTVTLKTTGLLTLMGMSGLHLPAHEGSEIAFFQQVLADIGDEQSIEQSLSTFSAHMRNLVRITELSDDQSLVLTDELGSGTDPSEGAALAVAILNHLRRRGSTSIATTHYKEIKAYALETEGVENASCEFDIKTLKPTYRLLIGVPGVSHAFTISQKLGLDTSIIEAARSHLTTDSIQFEALIQSIEEDRRKLDIKQRELDEERKRFDHELRQLKSREVQVARKQEELRERGLEETRETLRAKSDAIDALLKSIRQDLAHSRFNQATDDAETLREWISRDLNEAEQAIATKTKEALKAKSDADTSQRPKQIQVGETYYAPSLNFEGKVLTEPDKNGEVQLEAGVLRVNVKVRDLRLPLSRQEKKDLQGHDSRRNRQRQSDEERENRRRKGSASSVRSQARTTFGSELKLLGMRVEEALVALDGYLDQATLAGAERVRIVHGKGTGALRSAVHDMLRRDPRVRSYELAAFGEGDSGVTLADLK